MADRQPFVVAFRGELTPDEERALQSAGFGVHRDGIGTGAAWYGSDPSTGVEIEGRHVVTQVHAVDRDDALRRVVDVLDRDVRDPLVRPWESGRVADLSEIAIREGFSQDVVLQSLFDLAHAGLLEWGDTNRVLSSTDRPHLTEEGVKAAVELVRSGQSQY